MYPTKGTLLNISQLFTDSKHINMNHTKSFFVREYNFRCRACSKIYNDPMIIDCPCKCIMCKECLRERWNVGITWKYKLMISKFMNLKF